MFTAPIFDTLHFSKCLIKAGIPVSQAEAIAETQKEFFETQSGQLHEKLSDSVATKKEGINALRYDLHTEFKEDTFRLDKKMDLIKEEFQGKFNLLYWMVGFNLALSMTILFKLFA